MAQLLLTAEERAGVARQFNCALKNFMPCSGAWTRPKSGKPREVAAQLSRFGWRYFFLAR
jgi:hypothetical protein